MLSGRILHNGMPVAGLKREDNGLPLLSYLEWTRLGMQRRVGSIVRGECALPLLVRVRAGVGGRRAKVLCACSQHARTHESTHGSIIISDVMNFVRFFSESQSVEKPCCGWCSQ